MAATALTGCHGTCGILCPHQVRVLTIVTHDLHVFIRSLQLIPPTTVAVLRALEIVLAYGVQAIVLGEVVTQFLL